MVKCEKTHLTHQTHPICTIGECVYSVGAHYAFLIIGSSSWKEIKSINIYIIEHTHIHIYSTSPVNSGYGVPFLGYPDFLGLLFKRSFDHTHNYLTKLRRAIDVADACGCPVGTVKDLLAGKNSLVEKVLQYQSNQAAANHATDFEIKDDFERGEEKKE